MEALEAREPALINLPLPLPPVPLLSPIIGGNSPTNPTPPLVSIPVIAPSPAKHTSAAQEQPSPTSVSPVLRFVAKSKLTKRHFQFSHRVSSLLNNLPLRSSLPLSNLPQNSPHRNNHHHSSPRRNSRHPPPVPHLVVETAGTIGVLRPATQGVVVAPTIMEEAVVVLMGQAAAKGAQTTVRVTVQHRLRQTYLPRLLELYHLHRLRLQSRYLSQRSRPVRLLSQWCQ